jgi:flagellin
VGSIDTQRYLSSTQNSLNTALQRLSSGLRINSAKDDAAGMAIAARMNSQVMGSNVAVRNANDGVSLAQTAEGSLQAITNNLQRIRSLSVQSANASNSDSDRAALNNEAQSLLQEIDRVASSASFNGVKLLDGSFSSQAFQVGANAGDTITLSSISSARIAKLGSTDTAAVSSQQNATSALADGDLIINGVAIGPSAAAADTASTNNAAASSIAKAAAINAKSDLTGVTATVNATEVGGSSMTAAALSGSITLNGVSISISTTANAATSRSGVVAAINAYSAQTGVTAVDTGLDADGVKLVAADGRNVELSFTTVTAAATGLAAANTYTGSFTLNSTGSINLASSASGTISNAGLVAGDYKSQTAYVASKASTTAGAGTAITAGDFKINGVLVGASLASSDTASQVDKSSSAIAKAAAINALSDQTGVSAVADATIVAGAAQTAAASSGSLWINGYQTTTINTTTSAADSRQAVVDAINAISGKTGVVAVDTNSATTGVQLVAADGRNISVVQDTAGTLTSAATGLNAAFVTAAAGAAPTTAEYQAGTFHGSVTLSSTASFSVEGGTTGNSLGTALGLNVGTYGAGKSGQSLDSVDISTVDGATKALTAVDNALSSVNASRAQLGAVQNRFSSVVDNLSTTSENLSAALSRIQDADFAAETANYTKANVLQQAATSMLSQANSSSQQVLSLLQRL